MRACSHLTFSFALNFNNIRTTYDVRRFTWHETLKITLQPKRNFSSHVIAAKDPYYVNGMQMQTHTGTMLNLNVDGNTNVTCEQTVSVLKRPVSARLGLRVKSSHDRLASICLPTHSNYANGEAIQSQFEFVLCEELSEGFISRELLAHTTCAGVYWQFKFVLGEELSEGFISRELLPHAACAGVYWQFEFVVCEEFYLQGAATTACTCRCLLTVWVCVRNCLRDLSPGSCCYCCHTLHTQVFTDSLIWCYVRGNLMKTAFVATHAFWTNHRLHWRIKQPIKKHPIIVLYTVTVMFVDKCEKISKQCR